LRRRKIFIKTEKETENHSCLYKKQQQADAKVAREEAKRVRDAEKKAKAERLAASSVQKQQERRAANTQNALQLSQRVKRATSPKAGSKTKRVCSAVGAQGSEEIGKAAPAALLKQSRTCSINAPNRYSD
jgi:hypothetical protein